MLQNTIEVEQLMSASEAFLVPLRIMQGFDEQKFLTLCKVLGFCAKTWSEQDYIPKLGANILVDLYPAALSSSYLYTEEEGHRIRSRVDHLGDLVRECVAI